MIQNPFAKLIKSLQREALEEKTVRRRSSLTLQTTTKSITLTCRVHYTGSNWFLTKAGLAKIAFNTESPQIFTAQGTSTSDRGGRGLEFSNFNLDSGAGVIVIPTIGANFDSGMSANTDKDFTVKISITATGDFTLTADQINYQEVV